MKNKRLTGAFGMLSEGLDNPEPPKSDESKPEQNKPEAKEVATNKPVSKKPAAQKADTELVRIDPERVRSWKYKDRKAEDLQDADYETLMQSIARNGQDTPIAVRRIKHKDFDYEEITGFRRLNVCRALGIKVLAIVREIDDRKAFASQIAENDDRSAPSYWRRGQSLKQAMDDNLFPSMDAMSIEIGIGRSTIANYIRVVKSMPKPFIDRVALHLMSRDVLFYLISISRTDNVLNEWLDSKYGTWRFGINVTRKEVEKSFNQFLKQLPINEKEKPVKKDGAKTYMGKAGKLFSVTRKGDSVFINILKDGKRIMTEEEIADALQKIMDDKSET